MTAEPFNVRVATRYGEMVCNRRDTYVGKSLQLYGEYSEAEAELMRRLLPEKAVVIEAGANIGGLTIPMAKHIGDGGAVFAFEPQPLAYQLLQANAALTSCMNIRARNIAIGSQRGTVPIAVLDPHSTNNVGGYEVRGQREGEPTPMFPLDDLLAPKRLDLLKADVEGMEYAVLMGASRLIRDHAPMVYLEADREGAEFLLATALNELGYRLWRHIPPLWNPDNFAKNPSNVFQNSEGDLIRSINLLGIHRSQTAPAWLNEYPDLEPLGGRAGVAA